MNWFARPQKTTARKQNHKSHLGLEPLEDRCLTATSFSAFPATLTFATVSLTSQTAELVRNYDLVSGLRTNHNETLVRTRPRKRQCK